MGPQPDKKSRDHIEEGETNIHDLTDDQDLGLGRKGKGKGEGGVLGGGKGGQVGDKGKGKGKGVGHHSGFAWPTGEMMSDSGGYSGWEGGNS